jgi:hypothetical protein
MGPRAFNRKARTNLLPEIARRALLQPYASEAQVTRDRGPLFCIYPGI